MDKILFLCVVYATPPENSSTIKSLSTIEFEKEKIEPFVYVWDNSKEGYNTENVKSLFSRHTFLTTHTGRNESLSTIYNLVIDKYNNKIDWIIILDDDSVLDNEYIKCVKDFILLSKSSNDVKVAVPKIYNNNIMISPGKVEGVRGKILSTISSGVVNEENIVSMMSGTVISINDTDHLPRFDERLKFYGVDTKFFLDLDKSGYKKYILPYIMEHKSALRDTSLPLQEQFNRFDNLFKARKIIYEAVPNYKFRLFLYKFLFSIKASMLRRSLIFLKLIFS